MAMADKIGKKRGQYPARAGSAGFTMRSIERRKALQEGYPTSDRERPRSPAEMGRAVGFSGDDADLAPLVTVPARLPGRLKEALEEAAKEKAAAGVTDSAAIDISNEMRRKLGMKRGTKGSSEYE